MKIQLDATVCSLSYFTAKSLYMFRLSTAPIIRKTKNCNLSLPSTFLQSGQATMEGGGGKVEFTDFSTPDDGCGGHPKHVE